MVKPPRSRSYPIEASDAEIARLRMQAGAMACDAGVMLDRIGVAGGWRCLDLGCGCGGITELLSARVAPGGRVVGLDIDPALLAAAEAWGRARGLENVTFVEGDACRTGLARASFDLVHMRFLMSTAGLADEALAEAKALTTPGGVVAAQEPDIATLRCHPPHPAWDRLLGVIAEVFEAAGGDVRLARELYRRFREAGLEEVRYRPFVVGFTSSDAMADYLPRTIESLRRFVIERQVIGADELDSAVAACRRHLADPGTVSDSYLVAQVWGRKPR